MRLNDLNEKRALVVAEMRSITEKPTGTGGDLSTEQAQRFDQLKGDLQGLEQRIERQRFIDDAERRMTGQQIHGTGDKPPVETTALYGGTGKPRGLLQDEVLHLRDRADDGLKRRSRLQRAAQVLQAGMSVQQFANALYSNGANPSGARPREGKLTDAQLDRCLSSSAIHSPVLPRQRGR